MNSTPPARASRAATPLTVGIEDDVLTVRIGVASLAEAIQSAPDWPEDQMVDDIDGFARELAASLERREGEDAPSSLHSMLDRVSEDLIEVGCTTVGLGPVADGLALARSRMAPSPASHIDIIRGEPHRQDTEGRWTAESMFRPQDLLQDDMVRALIDRAKLVRDALAEFRDGALGEAEAFRELLAQEYQAPKGGAKGNVTFTTLDGLQRFSVRVNDTISFGPELQQAKTILDELISEWAADSRTEIRTIVLRAFDVGKEGQINKGELFMLLRLDIQDERWQRAMKAIRDSIRSDGTRTYVRFEQRAGRGAAFATISLDIAKG